MIRLFGRFCTHVFIPVYDNFKICLRQQQKNGKDLEPKIKSCLLTNQKSALIQKLLFKLRLDYFRIVHMDLIRPMASANQMSEVQVQGRCQTDQKLHQKINKNKKNIRLFPVHIPDKAQIHNFQLQGALFENKYILISVIFIKFNKYFIYIISWYFLFHLSSITCPRRFCVGETNFMIGQHCEPIRDRIGFLHEIENFAEIILFEFNFENKRFRFSEGN